MPICVSQGETHAVEPLDQQRQLLAQQRQLLRQDRHDQQHQRGERRSAPRSRPATTASSRGTRRAASCSTSGMERVGEHGADHERRQHRPEQPEQDDARRPTAERGPVAGCAAAAGVQAHRRACRTRVAPAVNAGATGRRGRARARRSRMARRSRASRRVLEVARAGRRWPASTRAELRRARRPRSRRSSQASGSRIDQPLGTASRRGQSSAAAVDLLQVAQHAGDDLARRRRPAGSSASGTSKSPGRPSRRR